MLFIMTGRFGTLGKLKREASRSIQVLLCLPSQTLAKRVVLNVLFDTNWILLSAHGTSIVSSRNNMSDSLKCV